MELIEEKVRPCLDLIDKLRSIGIDKDYSIPQIAVMGDQSSGKSSALEAITGIPFPRGTGTVTKMATRIQMKNVPESSERPSFVGDISVSFTCVIYPNIYIV
jgi:interferon-induced GTP-binding protein Mx